MCFDELSVSSPLTLASLLCLGSESSFSLRVVHSGETVSMCSLRELYSS